MPSTSRSWISSSTLISTDGSPTLSVSATAGSPLRFRLGLFFLLGFFLEVFFLFRLFELHSSPPCESVNR